MSAPDRRALIDRDQREPSIQWQCALLGVARSGVYRRSTSVAPLSAINDKTAATGAKPRPIKSIHHVCRIRRLFAATRLLPPVRIRSRKTSMKWKTPVIIEIAVGLEINTYACAEVK